MSDLALTTEPRYKVDTVETKTGRTLRITRKVRAAIDAMVWQGLKRDEAAAQAKLKDNSLYVALSRPDVKAYYLRQLEVLRTSERARNFHTLAEVRDQTTNQMARVNAVKALEQLGDTDGPGTTARQSAGLVIVINGAAAQEPRATNPVQVIDNTESET